MTKSITSTLAGIAKDQNRLTDLNQKISTYFPEYAELFRDEKKNQITLYHLLTMTAGLDWNEHSVSYFDPRNHHFIMERSGNPIKYLFERPMLYQPGEKYVYNSGLMITLGKIIERTSSIPLDQFAEKYLFGPLGISDYTWQQYPDSTFQAGGGLQMLTRDMAKLGLLYMHKGQFKGKRIVSEEWFDRSSQRTRECEGPVYWNHWFPSNYFTHARIVEVYHADGLGGQFIFAVPSLDMIVVFTSSIFGNTAQPSEILKDYILPSVITPSFVEKHPDFGDKKITKLENLNWSTKWHTELGCVKGCLDYFKSPVSDAWLYGATGHAFIINVHERVLSNSVGVWNNEMVYELGKNLGYKTDSFWALKSQDDFRTKQELAWNKVREAIDGGLPCYGFQLDIPESYIIYGYDQCGYYYKGVMSESGGGPKFWQELGDTDLGYLGIFVVKPREKSSDIKTVKDALQFALEHSRSPEKWIYSGYKAGPAGYDNWIRALKDGTADAFGVAYNAAVWSECRSYAVPFLEEAKNRLPAELHSLFDEAIAHYEVASENLHQVSKLFPFLGMSDEQREANVKDPGRCQTAIRHLEASKDAEEKGLNVLEKLILKL